MKKLIAILTAIILFCSSIAYAELGGATSGWIQGATENSSLNNVFKIAGSAKTFILLDEIETGKYLIVANEDYGVHSFSADGSQVFDPQNQNNIAYWLNNGFISPDYMGEKLPDELISYALDHTWETEPGYNSSEAGSVSCKVALLSKTEFENYVYVLGTKDNLNKENQSTDEYRFWWTRSPLSTADGKSISIGFSGLSAGDDVGLQRLVRPALCVDNTFFENVKLDTQYMGGTVKTILNGLNTTYAEYTDSEKTIIADTTKNDIVLTEVTRNWTDSTYDKNYTTDKISFTLTFTNISSRVHTKYVYWQINGEYNKSQVQTVTIGANSKKSITLDLPIKNDGRYTCEVFTSSDGVNFNSYSYDVNYIEPIGTKSFDKGYCLGISGGTAYNEKLELLEAAGVWTIRQSIFWNEVESSKGKYTWTQMDNYVKKALDKGIDVIMPLGLVNSLYRTVDEDGNAVTMGSDAEIQAFVNYCIALASRYPQITRYEIWNEANANNFWPEVPNTQNYIKMLKAVSTALKSINPDIEIIVGVTSNSEENTPTTDGSYWCINWKTFIAELMAEDVQQYYDSISIHTYYNNLTRADNTSKAHIKEVTELVQSYGGFKKIYMTETGAYSGPYSYNKTEDKKAREIVRQFPIGDQYNLDGTWIYNLVNSGTDAYYSEHNYGSVTAPEAGLRPMEAYYAMKNYLLRIDGAVYLGKTTLSDDITGHLYAKEDEAFLLAYGNDDTYTYAHDFGYEVTKYDLYGNKEYSSNRIVFNGAPCYVHGISDEDVWNIFEGFVAEKLQIFSNTLSNDAHKQAVADIITSFEMAKSADDFYNIIDEIYCLGADVVNSGTDAVKTRGTMHSINQICDDITDYFGFIDGAAEVSYDEVIKAYDGFKTTIADLSYSEDMGTWNVWNYALDELKSLIDDGEANSYVEISGEGYSLDKYGRLTLYGTAQAGDIVNIKIVNPAGENEYLGAVTADSNGNYTFNYNINSGIGTYTAGVRAMSATEKTDYDISCEKSETYVSFVQKLYYGKVLKNEKLLNLAREYLFKFGTPAKGSNILVDVAWKVTESSANAKFTVKNTGDAIDGQLILAAYDEDDMLLQAKTVDHSLFKSAKTEYDDISLTFSSKPYKLKAFLWSSDGNITPISRVNEYYID